MNKLWGVWHLKEKLGVGSFGVVYKAEKEEFGKKYYSAIKHISLPKNEEELESIIKEHNVKTQDDIKEYYDGTIDDLIREIEIMYSLRANSHIVDYQDHLVLEKKDSLGYDIYIRMELLTPINKYFEEKNITEADVIKIGYDISDALVICDNYNYLHRDIKPANVFINNKGEYKLGDFGIAKKLESTTYNFSKKGTFNYMSPEIYKGQKASISSDIYSLGILMYRFLNNNRPPFIDKDIRILKNSDNEIALNRRMNGEPLPVLNTVSPRLKKIIFHATNYDVDKRYKNPKELNDDLKTLINDKEDYSEAYEKTVSIYDDYEKTVSIYDKKEENFQPEEKENITIEIEDEDDFEIILEDDEVETEESNTLVEENDDELREKISNLINEEKREKNLVVVEEDSIKIIGFKAFLSFILCSLIAIILFLFAYNSDLFSFAYFVHKDLTSIVMIIVCVFTLFGFIFSLMNPRLEKFSKKIYTLVFIVLLLFYFYVQYSSGLYFEDYYINIILFILFILINIRYKWKYFVDKIAVKEYVKESILIENNKCREIFENYIDFKINHLYLAACLFMTLLCNVYVLNYLSNYRDYLVVTGISLNVRTGSSTDYEIIDSLNKYDVIEYVRYNSDGWYVVVYDENDIAYISSTYAKKVEDL